MGRFAKTSYFLYNFNKDKIKAELERKLNKGEKFDVVVSDEFKNYSNEEFNYLLDLQEQGLITISKTDLIYDNSYISDVGTLETLVNLKEKCEQQKIDFSLTIDHYFEVTPDAVLIAQKKLKNFCDKVNNYEVPTENGDMRKLSPAEKLILAYKFSSARIYSRAPNDDNCMRTWAGVLSTEYAICSGYSSLFQCVCDNLFKNNEVKCIRQSSIINTGDEMESHANNLVYIKDNIYGINGVYHCDTCWDSPRLNKHNNMLEEDLAGFFLVPTKHLHNLKGMKVEFKPANYYELNDFIKEDQVENNNNNYFSIDEDLMIALGYKSWNEYLNEQHEEIKDLYERIDKQKQQVKVDFENGIGKQIDCLKQDELLNNFFNLPFYTRMPKSITEQYPEFEKIISYFSHMNNNDKIDENYLLKYIDFYNSAKSLINKKIVPLIPDMEEHGIKITSSLKDFIWKNIEINENININENLRKNEKKIKEDCQNKYNSQFEQYVKENKDILLPKEISNKTKNSLLSVYSRFNQRSYRDVMQQNIDFKNEYFEDNKLTIKPSNEK